MNARGSQRQLRSAGLGLAALLPFTRVGYAVELNDDAPTAPGCACCGAEPASYRIESTGRSGISVPYCAACQRHLAKARTRRLAAMLASLLSAIAFGVELPMIEPNLPLPALIVGGGLLAAWPLLLELFWTPPLRAPHTALDRAAWWNGEGTLLCTRRAYARSLHAHCSSPAAISATLVQLKGPTPWLALGPALAVILVALIHGFFTPRLRVLNLSGSTLSVFVDGKSRLTLQPTSAESPLAGGDLRLTAGPHELEARNGTGVVVNKVTAQLMAGRTHLYAPESTGYCFWLETTSYGRNGSRIEREPLIAEERFWLLPHTIDLWFSGAPAVADPSRLSGGRLTALRQRPCDQAVTITGQ